MLQDITNTLLKRKITELTEVQSTRVRKLRKKAHEKQTRYSPSEVKAYWTHQRQDIMMRTCRRLMNRNCFELENRERLMMALKRDSFSFRSLNKEMLLAGVVFVSEVVNLSWGVYVYSKYDLMKLPSKVVVDPLGEHEIVYELQRRRLWSSQVRDRNFIRPVLEFAVWLDPKKKFVIGDKRPRPERGPVSSYKPLVLQKERSVDGVVGEVSEETALGILSALRKLVVDERYK